MAVRTISRRNFLDRSAQVASALAASTTLGQPAAATESNKEKWTSLFDGVTLTGWHKNPQLIPHGSGGRWAIENGILTGEQDPPGSGNGGIFTDRPKIQRL